MLPLFIVRLCSYFCNKQRFNKLFLAPTSCFSENINVPQKGRRLFFGQVTELFLALWEFSFLKHTLLQSKGNRLRLHV